MSFVVVGRHISYALRTFPVAAAAAAAAAKSNTNRDRKVTDIRSSELETRCLWQGVNHVPCPYSSCTLGGAGGKGAEIKRTNSALGRGVFV